jgi:DNA-binding transcriptional regulator YhcF (GntR family)
VSPPLWPEAARTVREMIAAGTLKPGDLVPSAREMAQKTGMSRYVFSRALAELARDGTLDPPASRHGRCYVPGGDSPTAAERELSAALAAARRAAGLTQAQFAERAGLSATTVHHAETARFRQMTPQTWARLDLAAGATGALMRLHAAWQAAEEARRQEAGLLVVRRHALHAGKATYLAVAARGDDEAADRVLEQMRELGLLEPGAPGGPGGPGPDVPAAGG